MEHSFWHDRWESGRIGFHESRPNALLVAHFPALAVPEGGRVFVPLCGKTLDIDWLLAGGHQVVGAELSELAIQQLFEDLDVVPTIRDRGRMKHYSADQIDIHVGDVFDLGQAALGPVDAVFDRAALVALPEAMRKAYTRHVASIIGNASQLLITFEYDQDLLDGPPFSISEDEIKRLYAASFGLSTLALGKVAGGFKGLDAKERVWLLRPL